MTRISILMAGAALAGLAAAPAAAVEPTGWYISGEVGATWLSDDTFTDSALVFSPTVDFDTGWAVFGSVGYKFNRNWRLELELGYRENDGDDAFGTDGDVSQFTQMVNVIFDLPVSDRLTLSLGGGVGGDLVDADFDILGVPLIGDDDYVFAWQGLAAASYAFNERWSGVITYRFLDAEDSSHSNRAIVPATYSFEAESHTATIGLRYSFGAPAVMAEPMPEPEPMPAELVAQQYLVFFDFNESRLTVEARDVIAQASAAYAAGANIVLVVGHTDTVGSARYNQGLSERRASSVKSEMVRLGVPASVISTEGRGFSDPLVPTGPGVREPQNRRAVIELR